MKITLAILLTAITVSAQPLSPKWDELTASDFVKALDQAKGVCVLPMGILEKHGPAGPIGTDLFDARHAVLSAVKEEFAVVFPEYFVGQIFEAQHQPGTVAYSTHLQMEFLQETTAEMARNGCTKVVLYSGHGGNTGLVSFFNMTQLEKPKDWVLYTISLGGSGGATTPVNPATAPTKPGVDGHAGESEISMVMAARPELVHTERSGTESGKNLARLDLPAGVSTSIAWYSMYPNHYAGDSAGASAARGKAMTEQTVARLVAALRAIKADTVAPRLQKEFFEKVGKPLATKQ
jgi:creatinine amidohydrolase